MVYRVAFHVRVHHSNELQNSQDRYRHQRKPLCEGGIMATNISDLTRQVKSEIESIGAADLRIADPEYWIQMFTDDFVDDIRSGRTTPGGDETHEFRALYRQVKTVIDESLIPENLREALSFLQNKMPRVIAAIGERSPAVAAEILRDMKDYAASRDHEIKCFAEEAVHKLRRFLPAQDMAAGFAAAAATEVQESTVLQAPLKVSAPLRLKFR
jgi:hypothetical protein